MAAQLTSTTRIDGAGAVDTDGRFRAGRVSGNWVGVAALRRSLSQAYGAGCAGADKSASAWAALSDKLYVDEFYGVTVIAFYGWWARVSDWLDRWVWGGVVAGVAWGFGLGAQLNRFLDNNIVDGGFDKGCDELPWVADCCRACRRAACRLT